MGAQSAPRRGGWRDHHVSRLHGFSGKHSHYDREFIVQHCCSDRREGGGVGGCAHIVVEHLGMGAQLAPRRGGWDFQLIFS